MEVFFQAIGVISTAVIILVLLYSLIFYFVRQNQDIEDIGNRISYRAQEIIKLQDKLNHLEDNEIHQHGLRLRGIESQLTGLRLQLKAVQESKGGKKHAKEK